MLYFVEIDVKIPDAIDPSRLAELQAREKIASAEYQLAGEWLHLWRIAGKFGSVSVFNVPDHDRLHEVLSSLPLFPFMTVRVLPLARHPGALASSPG
ncbi:muconolactone Delta-isomerase [Variovorax sp. VaC1]|uniref:muconolactone Delta-isomerase n=1 Tax=Variovorax sp. VaC1 TaxID=3373132 RepID=UPI0037487A94